MKVENARIAGTYLGVDEGRMILRIELNYGGTIQSATWPTQDFDSGTIRKLLACLELDQWDSLIGTPVRVKGTFSEVIAIGHFIKDRWFYFHRERIEETSNET